MSKFWDKVLEVLGISLQYLRDRFTEVSSLKGVLWLTGGGGWHALDPSSRGETVVQLMMIAVGLLLIFVPDKKSVVVVPPVPVPPPVPEPEIYTAPVAAEEILLPADEPPKPPPPPPPRDVTGRTPPPPPPKKRKW